jgi:protein required for attachment to host cells
MKKTVTWVLVADGARARILRNEGPGRGIEREIVREFAQDIPPGREIMADRPGRTFDSAGQGRHAMERPTDPREIEETRFLREIIAYVEKANHEHSFDRLVLVAPPAALGTLRAHLPKPLAEKVTGELNKDLTQVPVHDLAKHLGGVMAV